MPRFAWRESNAAWSSSIRHDCTMVAWPEYRLQCKRGQDSLCPVAQPRRILIPAPNGSNSLSPPNGRGLGEGFVLVNIGSSPCLHRATDACRIVALGAKTGESALNSNRRKNERTHVRCYINKRGRGRRRLGRISPPPQTPVSYIRRFKLAETTGTDSRKPNKKLLLTA